MQNALYKMYNAKGIINCVYLLGKYVNMNPFLINNYISPEYFCDREAETSYLIKNIENQTNTALFAQRRIGKSALIKQVFYLSKEDYSCIYIDLFPSLNLKDFADILANSIYQAYQKRKKGQLFLDKIKLLRPIISMNELTGNLEVTLDITRSQSIERTVPQLLTYLDEQEVKFVIALDEFQQILSYPEKNVEAILRTSIQSLKNVQFIFCGSHQHLMNEIFNNSKRPFYASCSNMSLEKIEASKYVAFCQYQFSKKKITIEENAIHYVLESTNSHTYFVQKIFHELYASHFKKIGINEAHQIIQQILLDNEMIFYQYRSLLTPTQWELMIGIAIEEKVDQPYAKNFIKKHGFTASSVKRSLTSLVDKGMVFHHSSEKEPYYEVQDKLLKLWLKYRYQI